MEITGLVTYEYRRPLVNSIKTQVYAHDFQNRSVHIVWLFVVFLMLASGAANAQNLNWNPVESLSSPNLPNAAEPYTACEASWRSFNGNGPGGPTKFSEQRNSNGVLVSMTCYLPGPSGGLVNSNGGWGTGGVAHFSCGAGFVLEAGHKVRAVCPRTCCR